MSLGWGKGEEVPSSPLRICDLGPSLKRVGPCWGAVTPAEPGVLGEASHCPVPEA